MPYAHLPNKWGEGRLLIFAPSLLRPQLKTYA